MKIIITLATTALADARHRLASSFETQG